MRYATVARIQRRNRIRLRGTLEASYPARLFDMTRVGNTKARSNPFKAALSARARRRESRLECETCGRVSAQWTSLHGIGTSKMPGNWRGAFSPLKATPAFEGAECATMCRAMELPASERRMPSSLLCDTRQWKLRPSTSAATSRSVEYISIASHAIVPRRYSMG